MIGIGTWILGQAQNDKILMAFGRFRAAECRLCGTVNDASVGAASCRPLLAGAKFPNDELKLNHRESVPPDARRRYGRQELIM
jgi:hypothetical protein